MDNPHEHRTPAPAPQRAAVATVTINATAEVPVPEDRRQPIRDNENRWFEPDSLVITYAQQYSDAGTVDEEIGPWQVTAVASGPLLSGGTTARRRAARRFQDGEAGDFPAWVGEYVDRYHPAKRA